MKTIKIILLSACLFFFGFHENGEAKEKKERKPVPEFPFRRFYVDISVGYNFKIGVPGINGLLNSDDNPFLRSDDAAIGKGLRVGANFGYKFNRYIGLEIGGGYIAYPKNVVSTFRVGTVPVIKPNDNPPTSTTNIFYPYDAGLSFDANRGWVSFQTILSPGFSRYNPYVKVGISVLAGSLRYSTNLGIYDYAEETHFGDEIGTAHYAGKKSFCMVGFTAALGFDCRINDYLSFFAEWQIGVYSPSSFSWLGEKQQQTGDMDIERYFLFSGHEPIFGNNHGLNIGLKFQF